MNTDQSASRLEAGASLRDELKPHQPTEIHIAIFVYGTLRFGQANHRRFCGSAVRIEPATTFGRLCALPAGYPALEVPGIDILMRGTADPLADAAVQIHLTAKANGNGPVTPPTGDWDVVHGELIVLADPLRSLPPIDCLEGFQPGQRSLYQRVLVPVQVGANPGIARTYIMPGCTKNRRLREGCWI